MQLKNSEIRINRYSSSSVKFNDTLVTQEEKTVVEINVPAQPIGPIWGNNPVRQTQFSAICLLSYDVGTMHISSNYIIYDIMFLQNTRHLRHATVDMHCKLF